MHHTLEIEVQAHWSESAPVYRIYVDDDLLTERTFDWPSFQFCIKERMICDLQTGAHSLRIEKCQDTSELLYRLHDMCEQYRGTELEIEVRNRIQQNKSRLEVDKFKINGMPGHKHFLKRVDDCIIWTFTVDNELKIKNAKSE
jgi:hypothetical protein